MPPALLNKVLEDTLVVRRPELLCFLNVSDFSPMVGDFHTALDLEDLFASWGKPSALFCTCWDLDLWRSWDYGRQHTPHKCAAYPARHWGWGPAASCQHCIQKFHGNCLLPSNQTSSVLLEKTDFHSRNSKQLQRAWPPVWLHWSWKRSWTTPHSTSH